MLFAIPLHDRIIDATLFCRVMFQKWRGQTLKSVLDGLRDKKRLRQEVDDEKQSKKNQVVDENIALNEMTVQRRIMLKYQKQMIKWDEVKHKKDLFELKKDEYNKWTIPQLRDILLLKRVLKMEHYQQQIKN